MVNENNLLEDRKNLLTAILQARRSIKDADDLSHHQMITAAQANLCEAERLLTKVDNALDNLKGMEPV